MTNEIPAEDVIDQDGFRMIDRLRIAEEDISRLRKEIRELWSVVSRLGEEFHDHVMLSPDVDRNR